MKNKKFKNEIKTQGPLGHAIQDIYCRILKIQG